jgi:23S rRNA (adenine2503-C2)-methyltransferase
MRGQAGLQISINSTDEGQRQQMFGGEAITLQDFSAMADDFKDPLGRKYCLNFAYASDFEVDASKLIRLFSPEKFMCKITPIHNNTACRANNIETLEGYTSYTPYKQVEKDLKEAGFDVLVFIPSIDEEDGLVTCGNLVLSKDCA